MKTIHDVIIIIPARYSSERLPGKLIMQHEGKQVLQTVYEKALEITDRVYIATPSSKIAAAAARFNANVIITSPDEDKRNGTHGCYLAATLIPAKQDDIIINLQGDQVSFRKKTIEQLVKQMQYNSSRIATPVIKTSDRKKIHSPHTVKVVIKRNLDAMYFSRYPIPFNRDNKKDIYYFIHMGIYAYNFCTLKVISQLPFTNSQISESLEQNCWIEHGYNVRCVPVRDDPASINTAEDLK